MREIDFWVLVVVVGHVLFLLFVADNIIRLAYKVNELEKANQRKAIELATAIKRFELEYDLANKDIALLHQDVYKDFVRKPSPIPDDFYLMWPSQVRGEG